jgi:hypothetical protein
MPDTDRADAFRYWKGHLDQGSIDEKSKCAECLEDVAEGYCVLVFNEISMFKISSHPMIHHRKVQLSQSTSAKHEISENESSPLGAERFESSIRSKLSKGS